MTPPVQPPYPTQPPSQRPQGPYYPPPPPATQPVYPVYPYRAQMPPPLQQVRKPMGCWQIGALILLAWWIGSALVGGMGFLLFSARSHPAAARVSATSAPSSTYPTAAPAPPVTVIGLDGATLGGLPEAFDAAYSSFETTDNETEYQAFFDGHEADVQFTTLRGRDGLAHVGALAVTFRVDNISAEQGAAIMYAFAPPDADKGAFATDGELAGGVFMSPQLAKTFPQSAFVNAHGKPMPAGSFTVGCTTPQDGPVGQTTTCIYAVGDASKLT